MRRRYVITQQAEGEKFVVRRSNDAGTLVASAVEHDTYAGAITAMTVDLGADALTAAVDGLLDETWVDDGGLAYSVALPGGRDFSACEWSWRDPQLSLVPLMLQTETDYGHFGAELAGFVESFSLASGTVHGSGRFYEGDVGVNARDLLLDGRRFGVSVDPSEVVEAEFQCTETDDEGWCIDGVYAFLKYEIAGVTMTPFPGFENAAIVLGAAVEADPEEDPVEPDAVAAGARVTGEIRAELVAPPAEFFSLAEPVFGEPFLGTLGDEFLVDQGDGTMACPLTITDEGQVFGHLARWGQCHVGYAGQCVSPPESLAAYAHFHVGEVRAANGDRFSTGALTVGCEHASLDDDAWQARDHYANAGNGWADVRAVNGELGVWVSGALRPDVTPAQLRVLRALSLSGDWRKAGRGLELIGALSVNVPGFPIAREALAASAMAITAAAMTSSRMIGDDPIALVAAGMVARCADCQARAAEAALGRRRSSGDDGDVLRLLRVLEARTRHMIPIEAEATRARLGIDR